MAVALLSANPKFLVLVRKLKLPAPYVRGLLDTMWDVCHAHADPVIGTQEEVEAAAQWPGEDGILFKALKSGGWIDPVDGQDGKWSAHNYWDHCPAHVLERLKKRRHRSAQRGQSKESAGVSTDSPGNVPGQGRDNLSPAPTPTPTPKEENIVSSYLATPTSTDSPHLDDATHTGSDQAEEIKTETQELVEFLLTEFDHDGAHLNVNQVRGLVKRGLTLSEARRVWATWAKLEKTGQIKNLIGYAYTMLESTLPKDPYVKRTTRTRDQFIGVGDAGPVGGGR
jgi:hypothetical protein